MGIEQAARLRLTLTCLLWVFLLFAAQNSECLCGDPVDTYFQHRVYIFRRKILFNNSFLQKAPEGCINVLTVKVQNLFSHTRIAQH